MLAFKVFLSFNKLLGGSILPNTRVKDCQIREYKNSLFLSFTQVCGRKFAAERLEKHRTACEKSKAKKPRKVFDMTKMRTEGTDAAQYVRKRPKTPERKTQVCFPTNNVCQNPVRVVASKSLHMLQIESKVMHNNNGKEETCSCSSVLFSEEGQLAAEARRFPQQYPLREAGDCGGKRGGLSSRPAPAASLTQPGLRAVPDVRPPLQRGRSRAPYSPV